jgi:hypothetical protein
MAKRRSPTVDAGYRFPALFRGHGRGSVGRLAQMYGPAQPDLRELTCVVRDVAEVLRELVERLPAGGDAGRERADRGGGASLRRRRTTSRKSRRSSRAPSRRVTRRLADDPAVSESTPEPKALQVSELDRAAARAAARRLGMIVRGPVGPTAGGWE